MSNLVLVVERLKEQTRSGATYQVVAEQDDGNMTPMGEYPSQDAAFGAACQNLLNWMDGQTSFQLVVRKGARIKISLAPVNTK